MDTECCSRFLDAYCSIAWRRGTRKCRACGALRALQDTPKHLTGRAVMRGAPMPTSAAWVISSTGTLTLPTAPSGCAINGTRALALFPRLGTARPPLLGSLWTELGPTASRRQEDAMIRRALLNSVRGLAPRARRDIAAAVAAGRFTVEDTERAGRGGRGTAGAGESAAR
jgi:hypothetical protein